MRKEDLFRAIGQAEDRQVLEAREPVPIRKAAHWPRYAALAACLVLLAGLGVWSISREPEVPGASAGTLGTDAGSGGTAAGASGDTADGSSYEPGEDSRPAMYSQNTEIGYLDQAPDPGGPGSEACLARMSVEEILAQDTAIFRGTVMDLNYLSVEMDGGSRYYTVAVVEVSRVFRGDLTAGTTYGILLPCVPGYASNSVAGALEDLTIGSEAIFMPRIADETTGRSSGDSWFCYADTGAQFYFSEGVRYLFLDTGHGLEFARDLYEPIADAETLDQVEDYLLELLES